MKLHCGDADGRHGVHAQQGADAAETVRQGAAQWTHQAATEDAGGGVVAGGDRAQAILVVEVAGQGAGQADEAAEGHAIEEHEPPAVAVAQGLEVIGHGFGFWPLGGVLGQPGEKHQGQHQRDQREAEHVGPAEGHGHDRCDQRSEHGARVTSTGNAHGLALMLWRIPLGRQRQGHGERSTGHTQEQAEQQGLFVAVDTQFPGAEQRADHDHLAHHAGGFWRDPVGQQAHEQTQHGASQDRRRDHQAALLGGQVQVGGDLYRQWAEQVPDHEAQVEVEEGREQGRGMAGFPEA